MLFSEMAHTKNDKDKILARISRLQGQLTGLRRGVEEEKNCGEVLHTLSAIKGALNGLMLELIEGHIRHHVIEAEGDESPAEAAEDLIAVLRKYLK